MDLTFSQKNFSVMTVFYLGLPGGDTHNVSMQVCECELFPNHVLISQLPFFCGVSPTPNTSDFLLTYVSVNSQKTALKLFVSKDGPRKSNISHEG